MSNKSAVSNVYYKKVNKDTTPEDICKFTKELLDKIVKEEKVTFEKKVPLKVHFGEKGNTTFIKAENYNGIIEFLKEKNIETQYMETSVVYGGQRYKKELHLKTAKEHGFTQLPVVIADGEYGEEFSDIEVNLKHYKKCKIGKEFDKYKQIFVISHFKGHGLAGFGGAIKQLSMGHAAKGGKLAMHMGIKPKIKERKCTKCGMCVKVCNEDAMKMNDKSVSINYEKCVGCGGCVAVCSYKAITILTLEGAVNALFKGKDFKEKLVEYALAAQKDKHNIYLNFAMSITKGCDCIGKPMKPVIDDIGVFVSTDPVAIDKACYDLSVKKGKKFKGFEQFAYAQKVGLGKTKYKLVEV